ncbi:hypothetical protein GCM10023201_33090 [Actinomycetospora corticicola]|uniref:hypothetical protein n=1 Tax=Actinomycetospora corticicola TaxID=663602 RepID=UPI0031B59AC9
MRGKPKHLRDLDIAGNDPYLRDLDRSTIVSATDHQNPCLTTAPHLADNLTIGQSLADR